MTALEECPILPSPEPRNDILSSSEAWRELTDEAADVKPDELVPSSVAKSDESWLPLDELRALLSSERVVDEAGWDERRESGVADGEG